jgi:hypothetical protein
MLESWINRPDLIESSSLENIKKTKCFEVGKKKPLLAKVGSLFENPDEVPVGEELTLILCQVVVGKAFILKKYPIELFNFKTGQI